ncbi:MAG: MFS transporter [Roseburia sp.]|nr:MFS transporter [Roseburia sp.]
MFQLLLTIIYLAFISLGLPDGLLGAAWPFMYIEFEVPVSYSGLIFMIIAAGTIVSSLLSDRMTRKWGTGKVTAMSVAMTAMALFGFSFSHAYWMLCLWAIPYGLGAGGVDASINNYVAIHYESKHMSWLHCMWGLGATIGPYIMGTVLSGGQIWNIGYRYVGILQLVLTVILILSLPLWKERNGSSSSDVSDDGETRQSSEEPFKLREVLKIPGAKETFIMFFCYCAIEQTAGLWASSYLVLGRGVDAQTAATFASLFYIGITVGRGISGFITMKLNDEKMIWMGLGIIAIGVILILLPLSNIAALAGLIIVGLGCAPVYPCVVHSTPARFGEDKSQAVIGIQMASAYVGTCLMPPIFGIIAEYVSMLLLPVYMLAILLLMVYMHGLVCRKTTIQ